MISLHLVLMVLAIICFFLAAMNWPSPAPPAPSRVNMIAAGLALWALATVVTV